MESAQQIVNVLLEADGEEFNARDYLLQQPVDRTEVNAESAMTANVFYHRTKTYTRTNQPIQVRRMGRTKRWVRQPELFRVPVKYGMYDSFYIDNDNAKEWRIVPEQQ
jgi:hypothetical protein